jgi:enamine deaminase RidA (YjgF/YER057c/UK114 family)
MLNSLVNTNQPEVVPVGKLHFGCLVEIEAIAEVDEK